MDNLTISVFGNQTFSEIINEIKLFSKYKINFFDEFDHSKINTSNHDQLLIVFVNVKNKNDYIKIKKNNFPLIFVKELSNQKNVFSGELVENLVMPFSIFDLKKKIILLEAKYKFKKSSLIYLNEYIIDKNERKIKKNDLELKLTEKEINFLILFSQSREPVSKNVVLKNVWNYSSESDTHTVETHIHRLRKKILETFKDNQFIKNNNKGYYI